ncbi:MAG: C10 family peptidase [Bacteroidales bacterium]|nr:C10 family peptidase [Bacteroidales bacterium]
MRRLWCLLSVACMFTLATQAQEISAEQSLQRAVATMSKKSYARKVRGKADFTLTHIQTSDSNGKALYYVFRNERSEGFMITAADQRANAVLGYTENGSYEQALSNPAFQSWMGTCQDVMQWLSNKEVTGHEAAVPEFNIPDRVVSNADRSLSLTIPGRRYAQDNTLPESVEPLLGGIIWGQNAPFNRLCPPFPLFDLTCAAGCVATAMAQIMKYYQWPKQGTGQNSYVSDTYGFELSADFSQSIYDWDNMLDDYSNGYTEQQANAVAKLMSDIGIAIDTDYDLESTAYHSLATTAMVTNFGYNKGMQEYYREFFSYAEWNDLLKNELAASRPILMGGHKRDGGIGHEFVLDGYDKDGMYHVNWGMTGIGNGYYDINLMNAKILGMVDEGDGYLAHQEIAVNCFPDKDGTSVAHPMLATFNEITMKDNIISSEVANIGMGEYVGKCGYVATIDDEIVASLFWEAKKGFSYYKSTLLTCSLDELGITPEMVGIKKCKVYPAYDDGTGLKAPLSIASLQNYILLSVDERGQFVTERVHADNTNPICKSIEFTRDYAGYPIKATALVGNEENSKTFDCDIEMLILDENHELMAGGSSFAYIDAGKTAKLDFVCKPVKDKVLEAGKTYEVVLHYIKYETRKVIPGEKVTFTLKDPGAEPSLTYSEFALDKTVLAPGEDITISFNVHNTGGFCVEKFYVFAFKGGEREESESMYSFPVLEVDLPNGTSTFTSTLTVESGEDDYYVQVNSARGGLNPVSPYLKFSVKSSSTGVSNVANTPDSAHYYDLQGRRVANPSKGIYVKGGKKVILKQQLD